MLHKETLVPIYVAVEGSQTSGESLEMEMSQMGFSAAYVPGVNKISVSVVDGHSLAAIESRFSVYEGLSV